MNFNFSGTAGWIISACIFTTMVSLLLFGTGFVVWCTYMKIANWITRAKTINENMRYFRSYMRHKKRIDAILEKEDNVIDY